MRWGSEQLPPDEKEEERKDGEGEWDEGRGEVDQSQPHWQWQHTPFPALTHVSSFTSQDHSDAGLQPKHTHTHWYTHIQLVWTSLLRPTLRSTGVSPNPLVVPSVRHVLPAWLSSLGWGWHWHQSIHTMPSQRRAHHATTASQLTQSPPPASLLVCFQGLSRL